MRLTEKFTAIFGEQPRGWSTTPGRVNLIGEHVDYNGGTVLPCAIERLCQVAIGAPAARQDGADVVWSREFDGQCEVDRDAAAQGAWSDYAVGAIKAARACGLWDGPAAVAIASDIPHGAGLSSSAALTVGVLKAAANAAGADLPSTEIARMAQDVERDYIGVPCGIMDQVAVASTPAGHALALDTRDLTTEFIALPKDYCFVVTHSGVTRALSDGRYAERRAQCEEAARRLEARHLCHLTDDQQSRAAHLASPYKERARHAASEQARAEIAIEALRTGDLVGFGEQMFATHVSLRDDFEVSTPAIDALVEAARDAGAVGARLTGGGFGGCIVSCVPRDQVDQWRAAVAASQPAARHVC